MDRWIVYHNPVCGQSRGALDLLLERGIEFDVVEYMKHPLDRVTLEQLAEVRKVVDSATTAAKEESAAN